MIIHSIVKPSSKNRKQFMIWQKGGNKGRNQVFKCSCLDLHYTVRSVRFLFSHQTALNVELAEAPLSQRDKTQTQGSSSFH